MVRAQSRRLPDAGALAARCRGDDDDPRPADRRRLVARRRHRACGARSACRRPGEAEERQRDRASPVAGLHGGRHGAKARRPPPDDPAPAVDAALGFVAQSPAPLMLAPLEDLLGLAEQPNLPGTIDEHPNWRRRLAPPAARAASTTPAVAAPRRRPSRRAAMTPRATLRLQFHRGFTFADAERARALLRALRHQPRLRLADRRRRGRARCMATT